MSEPTKQPKSEIPSEIVVGRHAFVVPAAAVAAGQVVQYLATASVLKLIADSFNDYQGFAKGNRSPMSAFAYFGNLAPDLVTLVVNIPSLPSEIKELDDGAVETLLGEFATQIQMPNDHARAILAAVLKLASDLRTGVNDVRQLILSINAKT